MARGLRRVVPDDDIEEGSSQPHASGSGSSRRNRAQEDDEVVDADVKTEQGGSQRQKQMDADPDQAMYDEVDRLTQKWEDQPIPANSAQRLRGLITEWSSMTKQFPELYIRYNNTAMQFQEKNDPPEDESKEALGMDKPIKELLEYEEMANAHAAALTALQSAIENRTLEGSPLDNYEASVAAAIKEYAKKTQRQKYANNQAYQAFRTAIWEARDEHEPMPPLAQTIPREEGDPDDSDEDILVGGATQGFKDPISLTVFVDPVTSTKCPHSFSRETIYAMFNQPTITCPAHGCRVQLTKADLVRNKNLENRVKAHLRREKERAEKEMRDAVDMTIEDSEEE